MARFSGVPVLPAHSTAASAIGDRTHTGWALPALATASIAGPVILISNVPPSSTFANQAVAFAGWGVFLALVVGRQKWPCIPARGALLGVLVSFGIVGFAVLSAQGRGQLPSSLAISAACSIAAAVLTTLVGVAASQQKLCGFRAVCFGLIVAGALSSVVGIVQVFAPGLADGVLISPPSIEGRASGNLRQPNHLSSLLLWSSIASVWLMEERRLRRVWSMALVLVFVFVLVLAASRTGALGVFLLVLWGALDRRLSSSTRSTLMMMGFGYLVFFAGLTWWAHATGSLFGGEVRLSGAADSPNSRLHIWANALSLVASHPWQGVGFGEFNFAWSLTPFANRPTAFFDHTHNLLLQLAVELGLPLAILICLVLTWALWRMFMVSRDAPVPQAHMLRAAFMMTLVIALHSLFEYPLWYAYFLLPTAFLLGLGLGADALMRRGDSLEGRDRLSTSGLRPLFLAVVFMALGGAFSMVDYLRVSAIFTADADAPSLSERIEAGKRSVLFAHHAHYAAATTAERPSEALPSFNIASHYLLDTRLMMAWAIALHESGDEDRGRYVAARLREFRNPDSASFFAPCDAPDRPGVEKPFQCLPPTKSLSFEDFR